ncbi:MAG: glycosyltransferase [Verrucomicrobia bacterium]|nr:glycosyltransferase [Verrucomicrobiota bacterium]
MSVSPKSSARVRVYLPTYRRPALLRRAVESLRAQTCADWICELHNDAPDDPAPAALVRELADPRITLHHHERNLGPIATFNLAHSGAPEPFFTLLEDDNWWEPDFLETMLGVLAARTEAEIAWANMRIWQETPSGWTDTGTTIWPVIATPHVSLAWPQLLQFDSPLHSNGAMLARAVTGDRLQVPPATLFSMVENVRERAFRYPLVLVPRPLANFAHTLQTARDPAVARWAQAQALCGAAFLRHLPLPDAEVARLWSARRAAIPPATSQLFFAGLLQPTPGFFRHATVRDWLRFLLGCIRHPGTTLAILRARRQLSGFWSVIDRATEAACARPLVRADVPPLHLADRADLAR